jgi:hypothetical protein
MAGVLCGTGSYYGQWCRTNKGVNRLCARWRRLGPWDTFVKYWGDFCYPSSDDVEIFAEGGPLVLRWRYDEIFEYVVETL